MAEFCLDCYNKLNETNFGEGTVELDYDLCEGCGEWKLTIVYFYPWVRYPYPSEPKIPRKETSFFQDLKTLIRKRKG
jgi:hypothetical protein